MFKAVIFDFDGVILDSEPIHYQACDAIFSEIGIKLTYQNYCENYIGLSDREIFPQVLKDKNYSIKEIHELIDKKSQKFTEIINASHKLPIVPGVDDYLKKLVDERQRIAICSGATCSEINVTLAKLNQGELKPYFETIVTVDDVSRGKPSPEGYLLTADRLKISPSDCMVFEDTPHGIEAARAAGMYVVALLTTHKKKQLLLADKIINHFSELL